MILQPVDVAPKQHTESAPRTHVADCSRTEFENKLKRDSVGQTLGHAAAVFDRPGDTPPQCRLRVSQPALRQRRPADVLEQGSGLRCWSCVDACHVDSSRTKLTRVAAGGAALGETKRTAARVRSSTLR